QFAHADLVEHVLDHVERVRALQPQFLVHARLRRRATGAHRVNWYSRELISTHSRSTAPSRTVAPARTHVRARATSSGRGRRDSVARYSSSISASSVALLRNKSAIRPLASLILRSRKSPLSRCSAWPMFGCVVRSHSHVTCRGGRPKTSSRN